MNERLNHIFFNKSTILFLISPLLVLQRVSRSRERSYFLMRNEFRKVEQGNLLSMKLTLVK